MCGLMKCCVNCKYYEHISELDDEVDWCHYPNQQGIISNDPNYVKSELSGDCEHYERLEYKQYIAPPPTPSQDKSELKIGDRIYVTKTEGKASYGYILSPIFNSDLSCDGVGGGAIYCLYSNRS